MSLSRRQFLWLSAASGVCWPVAAPAQQARATPFQHGVASGDPLTDRVILWTRVTPAVNTALARPIDVRWTIATDQSLARIVRSGVVIASAERDFTVKVDAVGLQPGRTYYYAFESAGARSPVGRTKTLPTATQTVRLAVVSCANYPAGFFNVYGNLAGRELDAVVHVGDYIYEFANAVYGDGAPLKRLPQPLKETIALEDYRLRYATYRTDPDLQEAHRNHPFIAVWDDHELADNAWSGGAKNHNPELGEGDWATRKAAAWRAYREWMPIREPLDGSPRLYRSFRFGSLVDLIMLDTRSMRDRQVEADDLRGLSAANRHLMGAAQEAWLYDTLRASQRANVGWRLIGQQVLFSTVVPPGRPVQLPDAWEGYQAERGRVTDFLGGDGARNVVFLTGDLHSSWALDIPRNGWSGEYQPGSGAGSLAVELVTPAVSSPGPFPPEQAPLLTTMLLRSVPALKYLDAVQRGYLLLQVTPERLRADWYHVSTVLERSNRERLAASSVCETGSGRLAGV